MEQHPSQYGNDHAHINVVRNPYVNTRNSTKPSPQRYQTPYNKITANRKQNMPQQTPRRDSSHTFPPNKKEVCQACGQYGHNQPTCYLTPKLLHILEWAKTNKDKMQPLLRKHKSMN